jgi:hypothetical protein
LHRRDQRPGVQKAVFAPLAMDVDDDEREERADVKKEKKER